MPAGRRLRIELPSPALVRWSADHWATAADSPCRDTGFGMHVLDLPTQALGPGTIDFTIFWTETGRWEGADFRIEVI
jgi:glucoamylase